MMDPSTPTPSVPTDFSLPADWRRTPRLKVSAEAGSPLSLIRVKRCGKCNSNFLLGHSPRSPYYKPCRCGRSDIERKLHRRDEWNPIKSLQFLERMPKPKSQASSTHLPSTPVAPPITIQASFLSQKMHITWNDFSSHFRIVSRRSKELAKGIGRAVSGKAAEVGRQFYNPTFITPPPPPPPGRPRRYRKRKSSKTWFSRIQRLVSLASIRRPRRARVQYPPSRTSAAEQRARAESEPNMYDTQKILRATTSTIEYENEAFEGDLPIQIATAEGGVRKRLQPMRSHGNEAPASGSIEQDQTERGLNICEENYTIALTSSLIVAFLSYASFGYFAMWLVLYSATLDLILPEMKYLHKIVTICSLLLMATLNFFRFYICHNADKNQSTYLFTGTKTLTALVIAALASLLVSDSYSEPPRAFHIIISSVMIMFLFAEGIALFVHQRIIRRINNDRIDHGNDGAIESRPGGTTPRKLSN